MCAIIYFELMEGSKKRTINQLNPGTQEDERLLFANDGGLHQLEGYGRAGMLADEDEALEDNNEEIIDDIGEAGVNDSEEEGDDLLDDMEKDYEERPELDQFEEYGLDDRIGEDAPQELSMGARLEVDRQLDREARARAHF